MIGYTDFDGLYVNTRLLRDHVSDVAEQKKLAQQLLERIDWMQTADVDGPQDQYCHLQQKIHNLIQYYNNLEITLEEIEEKAVYLSRDIRNTVRSDTEETTEKVNHDFL